MPELPTTVRVETGVIKALSRSGGRASVLVTRDGRAEIITIILDRGRCLFTYDGGDGGNFSPKRLREIPQPGTALVLHCHGDNPKFASMWAELPQSSGRNFGSLSSVAIESPKPPITTIRRPLRSATLSRR